MTNIIQFPEYCSISPFPLLPGKLIQFPFNPYLVNAYGVSGEWIATILLEAKTLERAEVEAERLSEYYNWPMYYIEKEKVDHG